MANVSNLVVRTLMLEKGISQQELLDIMLNEGVFGDSARTSSYVVLNMAITGRRTTSRYIEILQKAYAILVRL